MASSIRFTYELNKEGIRLQACTDREAKTIDIPPTIEGRRVISLGREFFRGCKVQHLSLPDTIDHISPAFLGGCYSLKSITVAENGGSRRFYSTLKTAIGDRTLKLAGGENTFSLLLSSEDKLKLSLHWLKGMDIPFPTPCAEQYFNRRCIFALELAAEQDDIPSLIAAESLSKITAANIDRLIDKAQSADASEALAHLMSYKQAHFGFNDVFSSLSRELSRDPFAPAEIKKLYSIKSADDRLVITGYKGGDTDIFIPERMGKRPITSLADHALSPKKKRGALPIYDKLKKVDLNKIAFLGEGSFMGCSELTRVTSRQVTHIPKSCFQDCRSLSSFDFTDIESIGERAFSGCTSLKAIDLTSSLKEIGEWAFFGCSGIEELGLSGSIKETSELCFARCSALKTLTLPIGTEIIGKRSFHECTSLEEIVFSPSVKKISWEAFSGCSAIRRLHIPGNVKGIGNLAFFYCTSITELMLDEGIDTLEWGAFSNCQSLETVHLPKSISKIDSYVFNECYKLKEIHIPPSITVMDPNVFNSCRFVRIYGKKGSYAQEYAWIYGIPFIEDKNMI